MALYHDCFVVANTEKILNIFVAFNNVEAKS